MSANRAGIGHGTDSRDKFLRNLLIAREVILENRFEATDKRLHLDLSASYLVPQKPNFDLEKLLVVHEPPNAPTTPSFNEYLDGVVRELEHLDNLTNGTNGENVFLLRVCLLSALLRGQKNHFVGLHRGLKGLN